MWYLFIKKLYTSKLGILKKISIKLCCTFEQGEFKTTTLRKIREEIDDVVVGKYSYGWINNNFSGPAKIGSYCSIANGVVRIAVNHPYNMITTHPILYNPDLGYSLEDNRIWNEINIGNDVWIGRNVIILPSVSSIGDGAIIGAGSVVTKNVKPYEIVGGSPARKIKDRFSCRDAEKIMKSKWWDLDEEKIVQVSRNTNSIDEFLTKINK